MSRWPMLRMQVLVEQRIFWRNRSTMFFTFVLPLVLLIVLALSDDPVDNIAAIVALGILSTSFQGLAIQLAMHRDQGIFKRIMATPLPPSVLVAGKILSTMLVVMIELVIIVAFGVLVLGASLPADPIVLLAFVVLGTCTFVALGYAVASVIPSSDAAPAIVNAVYLGLILVTVLMTRLEVLPDWIRETGGLLPLGPLVSGLQHAWIDGAKASDWLGALVLLCWGAAAATWTVRRFRWEPAFER